MILALHQLENRGLVPLLTYNLKWPIVAAGVGAALLIVLVRPPGFLKWFWMRWIGQISYGVYVIHALLGRPLHARFEFAGRGVRAAARPHAAARSAELVFLRSADIGAKAPLANAVGASGLSARLT